MRKDRDKIKDIFSSKLNNLEQDVPVQMWDRITEKLSVNEGVVSARKTPLLKQIGMVASVAAALILAILLFNDSSDERAKQIVSNFDLNTLNPDFTPSAKQSVHPQEEIATQHVKNNAVYAYIPKKNRETTTEQSKVETFENTVKTVPQNKPEEENKIQDKLVKESLTPSDLEDKIQEFANQGKQTANLFADNSPSKKRGFALAFEGNTGFSRDNSKGTVTNSLRKTAASGYTSGTDEAQQNMRDINVKYDHRQPISFGLLGAKEIMPGLSLETGIVYTYISSRIYSERMSSIKREDYQSFYYLGLPVTLNYNFAKWGKAEFYGSVGGMIQKDISGRYSEEQKTFDGKGSNTVINKENIHQSRPQVSVSSGVGATYPIYDKLHVYTTVGGAYFIEANNKYRTIYSDRKIQLDLNVGLKVKF